MSTIIEPNAIVPPAFEPAERGVNGRTYTPDDLLQMPDEGRFELVDGKLVERNMGAESSLIGLLLMSRIASFVNAKSLGFAFSSDCGYQIFPNRPKLVRYPDGSFVRAGRLPNNVVPKGHMRVVPDMLLEGVSPNDLAEEVQEKLEDYQGVHVPLIWVVYPNLRSVYVYRDGKPVERLVFDGTLIGDDVLPGFTCQVAEIFPSAATEPEQQPQS